MSSSKVARFGAFIAVGALLIAGGIARAEPSADDTLEAVVASSTWDCDYGWHSRVDRRRHVVIRRLPNGRKVLAHGRMSKSHPVIATTRHERRSLVVADNGLPVPPIVHRLDGGASCADGPTWNLMCPGAQVIGVTY
jgi:hypothetical protein